MITFDPPTPAEASRQYQLAVEHERRVRGELEGVVSASAECWDAMAERTAVHQQLVDSIARHDVTRLLERLP